MPSLRWTRTEPDGASFDWSGNDSPASGRWLYASRAGIHVALSWDSDGTTEIDVTPVEIGPYAWEGKCKSLEAAKDKAVQLVQASLARLAKAWGVE